MIPIVTLTMNPCVDRLGETERIEQQGRKTRCTERSQAPGGGGINVARGVKLLGGEALAVYPTGGPAGERLDALMTRFNVPRKTVPIAGEIRQNLALEERAGDAHLHLVFPGPELSEAEWRGCADALLEVTPAPDFVVLSGSLPPGVPAGFYAELAGRCAERGSRVVLDTSGPPLEAALRSRVFLVKPNRREFAQLFDFEAQHPADYLPKMADVVEEGVAEAVVVTLGADGALLVSAEERLHVRPPPIEGRSPVGAGDSFVAALVHRLASEAGLAAALQDGVAAAAAAVKHRGTELLRAEELEQIRSELEVTHHR